MLYDHDSLNCLTQMLFFLVNFFFFCKTVTKKESKIIIKKTNIQLNKTKHKNYSRKLDIFKKEFIVKQIFYLFSQSLMQAHNLIQKLYHIYNQTIRRNFEMTNHYNH